MTQPLPTDGHFYFSASPDQVEPIYVDDQLVVSINGETVFARDLAQPTLVEIPVATIQAWIDQPLVIEFRDVYGAIVGSRPVWLIWTP